MSHSPLLATVIDIGNITGIGNLANVPDTQTAIERFTRVISNIVGIITIFAGIWFIFQILNAAFQWLTSGGEKQQLQNAQKRLMNALIGLFIVVIAYTIFGIIGLFLGINFLDIGHLLIYLTP